MKKSPLAIVKDRFGDDRKAAKAKLVAEVTALTDGGLWIDRVGSKGLEFASNKQLLHLHDVLSQVKSEFGSRDKLVAAILELESRTKDEGYKSRFEAWSTPRLVDYHKAAKKRAANVW